MWGWSFVSAVCFFLVFLSVRGHVTIKRDGLGRKFKWHKPAFDPYALGRGDEQYGPLVGTVGKTMCWLVVIDDLSIRLFNSYSMSRFPISYIILTLPISVSRVLETFGFRVPVYAFVFSAVCFLLLG